MVVLHTCTAGAPSTSTHRSQDSDEPFHIRSEYTVAFSRWTTAAVHRQCHLQQHDSDLQKKIEKTFPTFIKSTLRLFEIFTHDTWSMYFWILSDTHSLIIKYWLQPATLIHAANYTITRCPQTQNISDNDNHLAETLTKSNQWFKSRFIQIPVYAGQLPKWSGFIPGHFTEFRVKSGRWVTVGDMLIKLRKGPILHGEGSGKVFQNLYLGSEHHQTLISSSDW